MKKIFILICCVATLQTASAQADINLELAAKAFIRSLDTAQRAMACMQWDSEERFNWNFVPIARKGLPLKMMSNEQRALAFGLLNKCMSANGYKKARDIVANEEILRALEGRKEDDTYRDPGKYYFTFFGEPNTGKPWGWRMEGHHLSLNFSSVKKHVVAVTPAFMGANPAIVPDGPNKGKQVLKEESDLAFSLLHSLNKAQLQKTIVQEKAPAEIITGNKRKAWLLDPPGMPFTELGKEQQQQLKHLIAVYVDRYTKQMADIIWKDMEKAGWKNVHFAWAGAQQWGAAQYYRIQGPSFLIEYDNTQNNANHVHTTFRELNNDFGEDLLEQHYKTAHRK